MRVALLFLLLALASAAGAREAIDYGPARRQSLTFFEAEGVARAPVLIFVHGGGWAAGGRDMGEGAAPAYFAARGMAWASIGYRLVPGVRVEEQIDDIARAIRMLVARADRLGLDPGRIAILGHSSGAHLAAMIGADPARYGLLPDAIRAVVSLDGAGLDLQGFMAAVGGRAPHFDRAFGADPARWRALDPLSHAAAPNSPHWLLAYDSAHNQAGGYFAGRLGKALEAGGAQAELLPVTGTSHMGMLRNLGVPGDALTARVSTFLDAAFADQSKRGPVAPRM